MTTQTRVLQHHIIDTTYSAMKNRLPRYAHQSDLIYSFLGGLFIMAVMVFGFYVLTGG